MPESTPLIRIRGASQHNLDHIDLDLPRNRFIVITGVSGSGKSSLAFDTLFAEGQRRYLEAFSSYARRFLPGVVRRDAPRVESIEGLSPAIALEQRQLPRNPRSTVGTLTEIHDHLRLLYAHLGTVFCPDCNQPIQAFTIARMVQETFQWPEGTRIMVLAPLGQVPETMLGATFRRLRREGYARIRANGTIHELDPPPALPRRPHHSIDVVVDRLVLRRSDSRRLSDALELAASLAGGTAAVLSLDGTEKTFCDSYRCGRCGREAAAPTPSLFSFHHPLGACPVCRGLGIPVDLAKALESEETEEDLLGWGMEVCEACGGSRFNPAARAVRLAGLGIHEASRLPLLEFRSWLTGIPLDNTQAAIAERPLREILRRLDRLEELDLAYLTLERVAASLSGGEAQRVRLAQQLSAPLSGVLYILDEPSVGLHARDHRRVLRTVRKLLETENTVIVVEHDFETILAADHVVDLGPGAGTQGGRLLYAGPPAGLTNHPTSLTGRYLSGKKQLPPSKHRTPFQLGALKLVGATGRNLKNISAAFPVGCLTCVTGVSGSGKSTLVMDTLYRAMARLLHRSRRPAAPFQDLQGWDAFDRVVCVDQAPIGKSPRSTPATYTGVFDLIRNLYARLPEARARGYSARRFSFNSRGGRCETCGGDGVQRIEMVFLPDVYVTCADCGGRRYLPEVLDVRFKGHSIADVLAMTVLEALDLFANLPAIRGKLDVLQSVGLGYLGLGQPGTTLSGGEAQRLKLAKELGRKARGRTLYLMDEPTTGLHADDIAKLLDLIQRLIDAGNTVILIEHHLDVIQRADYVMDLGPEGGPGGGFVVAEGTPQDIAAALPSHTGEALRRRFRSGGEEPWSK